MKKPDVKKEVVLTREFIGVINPGTLSETQARTFLGRDEEMIGPYLDAGGNYFVHKLGLAEVEVK